MSDPYINNEQSEHWRRCSTLLRQASDNLDQVQCILLLELNQSDTTASRSIDATIEKISGLAYMFAPQPEWTDGDSSDPANTKMRQPRIVNAH